MLIIEKTDIEEVKVLRWESAEDNRGLKLYTFSERELQKANFNFHCVEETIYKIANKNTLYGVHYQNNPKPQAKIVYCLKGKGFDFVVDLRKKSSTYKKWVKLPLDSNSNAQVYVPPGFGHAFLSTEDDTHLVFRIDEYFDERLSRSISFRDKDLNIDFNTNNPILSRQDMDAPSLRDSDCNL